MNEVNDTQTDYLWDPAAPRDAEIEKLERILAPLSARARNLAERSVIPPNPSPTLAVVRRKSSARNWAAASLAAAATTVFAVGWHFHRLAWTDSSPWSASIFTSARQSASASFGVGDQIVTAGEQTAFVKVARIGTVTVSPNSSISLVETRPGRHRIHLAYGRIHAKIWAPPTQFGVTNSLGRAVDMGCEFEMQNDSAGIGTLTVMSGWVFYRLGNDGDGVGVPEGHAVAFNDMTVGTPIRVGAAPAFIEAVAELDKLYAGNSVDGAQAFKLTERIASIATDADRVALLSLMTRHRELLSSALYSRLVAILGEPGPAANGGDPINTWWSRLPTQPKNWWVNWRDAF